MPQNHDGLGQNDGVIPHEKSVQCPGSSPFLETPFVVVLGEKLVILPSCWQSRRFELNSSHWHCVSQEKKHTKYYLPP